MNDGSYGMTPRPDGRLHVVIFEPNNLPLFIAFDRAAAKDFGEKQDYMYDCEVTAIHEVALIDNYGFHVKRADAGYIAPWLAEAKPEVIAHFLKN